jgi:hypothetical protein
MVIMRDHIKDYSQILAVRDWSKTDQNELENLVYGAIMPFIEGYLRIRSVRVTQDENVAVLEDIFDSTVKLYQTTIGRNKVFLPSTGEVLYTQNVARSLMEALAVKQGICKSEYAALVSLETSKSIANNEMQSHTAAAQCYSMGFKYLCGKVKEKLNEADGWHELPLILGRDGDAKLTSTADTERGGITGVLSSLTDAANRHVSETLNPKPYTLIHPWCCEQSYFRNPEP